MRYFGASINTTSAALFMWTVVSNRVLSKSLIPTT
jgi:hypothetical protein